MTSSQNQAVYHLQGTYGGRHEFDFNKKVIVRRERLDRQGYTSRGRYFGAGAPLWHVMDAATEGMEVDFYVRAYDAEGAKTKVADAYPGVRSARRRR